MTISKTDGGANAPSPANSGDSPLLGMTMAVTAFLMLSLMSLFAKLLSETHNVIEIAFWRNLIAVLPFVAMILLMGRRDMLKIHSRPGIIAMRAIVGTLNLMLVFGAFSLLPMADATSLIFASALFTPVLGVFYLGESVGPYRASAVIVGFIGVIIVAQPGGEGHWNLAGVAMALTAAFFAATLAIMLRFLGQSEAPETVTFYFLLLGALFLAPFMPFLATWPTAQEIPLLLGLGISGALMQITLTMAFKYAQAALVSPLTYTQIVWATFFGWAVFGDIPGINIIVGAAIIVASSLIVILRERYLARQGRLKRPPTGTQPPKPL